MEAVGLFVSLVALSKLAKSRNLGFESGATNNPFYKGEYFANDQDVVLVSFK